MKRLWILTLFVALPMCLLAQQKTEYNRKGDEAMKRLDYSDARMWYEEGVVQCDLQYRAAHIDLVSQPENASINAQSDEQVSGLSGTDGQ